MSVVPVGTATTEGTSLLEPLGVTAFQEAVYEQLLQRPKCSEREVARRMPGVERDELATALDALEGEGLISRLPDATLVVAPPGLAIEALALRRQHEVDQVRAGASRFVALHAAGKAKSRPDASELVELIRGRQAIRQHYMQLELSAKRRVRVFEQPPYLATPANRSPGEPEFEVLARGVVVEAVYDASVLQEPGRVESIERCVAAGEQARIAQDLPSKLAIFDDEVAVLAMAEPGRVVSDVVVLVHQSTLLTSLIALFEAYWRRAIPFGVDAGDAAMPLRLPRRAGTLLTLLLAGLTNEAIGRQLRVTPRTVQRWVDELGEKLETPNKYQMLLKARELGLV